MTWLLLAQIFGHLFYLLEQSFSQAVCNKKFYQDANLEEIGNSGSMIQFEGLDISSL